MFSNPIKRLSESLAQAQEQARQQIAKQQRASIDRKPASIFDTEKEEANFTNGDESTSKTAGDEAQDAKTEEGSATSTFERKDDTSLPKDVRIKLAKLAKYEDRHPKLQAAYKESQARIATFEKVLRERTPLGSIDEVDDFGNYLNTLSMRTNMSLEELKRVTEARNNLEIELKSVQEQHQQESASQETTIADLRKQIEELETKAEESVSEDVTGKLKELEKDLAKKSKALSDAKQNITSLETEISKLNGQIEGLNAQIIQNASDATLIASLQTEKETMAQSLKTLQSSLDELEEVRKRTEAAIESEKAVSERRIADLEEKNRQLNEKLSLALASVSIEGAKIKVDQQEEETPEAVTPSESVADIIPETSGGGGKKKKKKKKKATSTAPTTSTSPALSPPEPSKPTEKPEATYPSRLLEEYLANLSKTIGTGDLSEIMQVETQVHNMENKLSAFAGKVVVLTTRLEDLMTNESTLKSRLAEMENDLSSHKGRLQERTEKLESANEETEQLRDMLRDVGSDLVEAKDKIKDLEQKISTAETTRSELEETITRLKKELEGSQENDRSLEEVRSKLAEMEGVAASRLTEISEAIEKLTAVETELIMLKSELATTSADKNDLTSKLRDAETRLRQLDRSEKEARESALTAQNNFAAKEQELSKVRAELADLQSVKGRVDEILRSTKQALFRVEAERNDSQRREESARQESARYKREADTYQEKIVSLDSLCTSLKRERDSLTEELQIKSTQVESAQTFAQHLREQTAEMGHRAREAKDRCEALEEELSEAHKILTERAREASTMRRLLDEAEGREEGRVKQAMERLESALEERDRLEEEIAALRRTNAEGSGAMTKTLKERETSVKDLTTRYDEAVKKVSELIAKNTDITKKLQQARKEADEALAKAARLSKSLEEATTQSQQLQQERNMLKEAAEESQIRVEQLQRTQRHLSDELKKLKSIDKRPPPTSPRDSKVSLVEPRSPTSSTPRQSVSLSTTPDPNKAAIDREYIKNVLLQFFEHKDKRAQLLPVLSMLLNFTKAEEMKILK